MNRRSPHFRNSGDEDRLRDLERLVQSGDRAALLDYARELRASGADSDAVLAAFDRAADAGVPGARLELALEIERGGAEPVMVLGLVREAMEAGDAGAVREFAKRVVEIPMQAFEHVYHQEIPAMPAQGRWTHETWHSHRFSELFRDRVSRPFATAVQRLRLLAYLGDADAKRFLTKDLSGHIDLPKMQELPHGTGSSGTLRPFKDLGPTVMGSLGAPLSARLGLAAVEAVRPFAPLNEVWPLSGGFSGQAHEATDEALDAVLDAGRRVIGLLDAGARARAGNQGADPEPPAHLFARLDELEAACKAVFEARRGIPSFHEPTTPPLSNRDVAARSACIAIEEWASALHAKDPLAAGGGRRYSTDPQRVVDVAHRAIYFAEVAMAWRLQHESEGYKGSKEIGTFGPWAFMGTPPQPRDGNRWMRAGKARVKAAMLAAARSFIA